MSFMSLGTRGEDVAADYLKKRGCQLLAKNFRVKSGEIDLVVMHRGRLCFVEVKARRSYDVPQEAVSIAKQRRLTRLARIYLARNFRSEDIPCRFDVVAVEEKNDHSIAVQWFQGAFDAV